MHHSFKRISSSGSARCPSKSLDETIETAISQSTSLASAIQHSTAVLNTQISHQPALEAKNCETMEKKDLGEPPEIEIIESENKNSTSIKNSVATQSTEFNRLTDLENPDNFSLNNQQQKRITKKNFIYSKGTLNEPAKSNPGDPLNTLDPLWTLKSAK